MQVGRTMRVGGWVKTGRIAGGGDFAFLEVNDGSTFANLQACNFPRSCLRLLQQQQVWQQQQQQQQLQQQQAAEGGASGIRCKQSTAQHSSAWPGDSIGEGPHQSQQHARGVP
jgi:aspartyl/asparaginyl-tRNA synthetase